MCIMENISPSYSCSSVTQFQFQNDSCNVFSCVSAEIFCAYTCRNLSVYVKRHIHQKDIIHTHTHTLTWMPLHLVLHMPEFVTILFVTLLLQRNQKLSKCQGTSYIIVHSQMDFCEIIKHQGNLSIEIWKDIHDLYFKFKKLHNSKYRIIVFLKYVCVFVYKFILSIKYLSKAYICY